MEATDTRYTLADLPAGWAVASEVALFHGEHLMQWWKDGAIEGDTGADEFDKIVAELLS